MGKFSGFGRKTVTRTIKVAPIVMPPPKGHIEYPFLLWTLCAPIHHVKLLSTSCFSKFHPARGWNIPSPWAKNSSTSMNGDFIESSLSFCDTYIFLVLCFSSLCVSSFFLNVFTHLSCQFYFELLIVINLTYCWINQNFPVITLSPLFFLFVRFPFELLECAVDL